MTIEEKAKAYDEAIERAKPLMLDTEFAMKSVVASIFPQLAESDDERVRKEIISIVKEYGRICEKQGDPCSTINDCLAYLEKQKDASKAIEAVERIDKYIDEHVANAHDMKDSHPDKKYYRGWDDALGKMAGILQDVYSGEKQKEQKPAEQNTRA